MPSKEQKVFYIIYGLARMVFGTAILVALSGGYFLKEWIIDYPSVVIPALFDSELVAVTYLAVIFRGIFHMIAGVLMARGSSLLKNYLIYGWPVMGLISVGLAYIYHEQWAQAGEVVSFFGTISLAKVVGYIAFIVCDIFIGSKIASEQTNTEETISFGKVFLVLFTTAFIVGLVLFAGKPVKKGFHHGFYKTTGRADSSRSVTALKPMSESQTQDASSLKSTKEASENIRVAQQESAVAVKEDEGQRQIVVAPKINQEEVGKEGYPYAVMIAWLAALCLMLSFVFNFNEQMQAFHVLLGIGFILLCVYAIVMKLWPLVIAGLCCGVGSLVVSFYKK